MKEIQLTQRKVAIVDDEDFETINSYKWCYGKNGYAVRTGYKKSSNDSLMHRMILNTPVGKLTDHINHNKLDNRKENLRICTKAQNMRNTISWNTNRSGLKGVSWNKNAKKWSSSITYNYKTIHIGYFSDKEEAGKAHDDAAKKYHGEYALTNEDLGLLSNDSNHR